MSRILNPCCLVNALCSCLWHYVAVLKRISVAGIVLGSLHQSARRPRPQSPTSASSINLRTHVCLHACLAAHEARAMCKFSRITCPWQEPAEWLLDGHGLAWHETYIIHNCATRARVHDSCLHEILPNCISRLWLPGGLRQTDHRTTCSENFRLKRALAKGRLGSSDHHR